MTRTEQADVLYEAYQEEAAARTSRLFTALMVGQWLFAIAMAALWSPYGWQGKSQSIHLHVWMAVGLGWAISSVPVAFTLTAPSAALTRHVVAVGQMLWSALLIHLSGGRIETHFHVFGSLAFLAFYRDWRVLVTATVVVVADHLARGVLWPESVYGVSNPEWWRFVEHAFWVVFEDAVLVLSCLRGVREARLVAQRQAEAEYGLEAVTEVNRTLDQRVEERTRELSETNAKLQESLLQLKEMQVQMVEVSRQAGMAEVATAVLHNVGNVLNSVNVSAGMLVEHLERSKASSVPQLAALLNGPELGQALQVNPKGKQVATYVTHLGEALRAERDTMRTELDGLQRNIEHIKVIVSMQQAHARGSGAPEPIRLQELLAEAVRMSQLSRGAEHVEVACELEDVPEVLADRHKVFLIVMNLLGNARHAIRDSGRGEGKITVRLARAGEGRVRVEVVDTGCGLSPENAARLFRHGFTTKKDGHGFGLHSSACAAMELGGALTGRSDGEGLGATFALELPVRARREADGPGRAA